MNFPVGKKTLPLKKTSDLQNIWSNFISPSSSSSPMSSPSPPSSPTTPTKKKNQDILTLIAHGIQKPSKKKLYSPPIIEMKVEKKKKVECKNHLFSKIIVNSQREPEYNRELLKQFTYVFKSDKETQKDAWSSFRSVYKSAKESVVRCSNIIFHFANGKVTAKSKTKSGEKQLESIFTEEPYVDEEKAIGLIDSLVEEEGAILSIFSTVCFSYAVAYPVKVQETVMGSNDGTLHRYEFSGYLLSMFCDSIRQAFDGCGSSFFTTLETNI